MPQLQTHRRRYLVLLLLLCPIAAFVLIPHPVDMSVYRRGKKLAPVTDWMPPRLAGALAYQWRSPNEIVVMHQQGRIGIVDTVTGVEHPLDAVDRAMRARPQLAPLVGRLPVWVVSPDGKWILFAAILGARPEWIVVAMDGSRVIEAPTPSLRDATVFWEHDSHGFMQLLPSNGIYYARRFTMDGPNPPESNPAGKDARDLRLNMPPYRFDNPYVPLGEFAQDYLLMANFGGRGRPRCLLFNLRSGMSPVRADIKIPAGAVVSEMELSPDGRRVGWIFDFAVGMSDPVLRRFPFTPVGPGHGNNEVWVSDLDGAHMHPIATPGIERDARGPTNLRWTLDSRSVSFLYDDFLYSASAD